MPLIIFCGIPASGKSTRAKELQIALRKQVDVPVVLIGDHETVSQEGKTRLYSSVPKEKDLRAAIRSDIQRLVSADNILIVDALNYIKGYRYEIWCLAKAAKSTQCTIWCNTPIQMAKSWNQQFPDEEKYSEDVLDALIMRFETPDNSNRWENPLFTLLPDSQLPIDDIISAIMNKTPPPPNQSTQSQPLAAANFLHQVDLLTQEVTSSILNSQLQGQIGSNLSIPGTKEVVILDKKISGPELSRLRRQFISQMKTRPVDDLTRIKSVFVQYLNTAFSAVK